MLTILLDRDNTEMIKETAKLMSSETETFFDRTLL